MHVEVFSGRGKRAFSCTQLVVKDSQSNPIAVVHETSPDVFHCSFFGDADFPSVLKALGLQPPNVEVKTIPVMVAQIDGNNSRASHDRVGLSEGHQDRGTAGQ